MRRKVSRLREGGAGGGYQTTRKLSSLLGAVQDLESGKLDLEDFFNKVPWDDFGDIMNLAGFASRAETVIDNNISHLEELKKYLNSME